jgi:hypothetical protein
MSLRDAVWKLAEELALLRLNQASPSYRLQAAAARARAVWPSLPAAGPDAVGRPAEAAPRVGPGAAPRPPCSSPCGVLRAWRREGEPRASSRSSSAAERSKSFRGGPASQADQPRRLWTHEKASPRDERRRPVLEGHALRSPRATALFRRGSPSARFGRGARALAFPRARRLRQSEAPASPEARRDARSWEQAPCLPSTPARPPGQHAREPAPRSESSCRT